MPHAPSSNPRRRPRRWLAVLALTLTVALAAGAAAGIFLTDELVRYTFMRRLCSDDPQKQQTGIGYLARHADDPAVLAHARRMLADADADCFEAIVTALDAGGAWGPQFGSSYLRYLDRRLPEASADERAGVAVALARIVFNQRPGHDDARLLELIDTLLTDDDPKVRLNALTAAATLPPAKHEPRIAALTDDAEPAVAARAHRMISPLTTAAPAADPGTLAEPLRRLFELEQLATNSVPGSPELSRATPPLIRLHLVRTRTDADPLDMLSVFRSEQPTLRDLATIVARQRFDDEQLKPLARELIASFAEPHRRAGVILAAMLPPDDELHRMIRTRFDHATDWLSKQHYRLALWMIDELDDANFDPANLLLRREFPRTTLITAMLHHGDLRGLDWLLGPIGEPGVGSPAALRLLMDTARYHVVLAHYLPDAPPFDPWADRDAQLDRIAAIRDWYLMHRNALTFDAATHTFDLPDASAD